MPLASPTTERPRSASKDNLISASLVKRRVPLGRCQKMTLIPLYKKTWGNNGGKNGGQNTWVPGRREDSPR